MGMNVNNNARYITPEESKDLASKDTAKVPLSMDAARAAKTDSMYKGARYMTAEESKQSSNDKVPLSMDDAKTMKTSDGKAQISDTTKKHLQKQAELRTQSVVNQAKAAPGIVYGVADIAAGEKVSGVVSLVKSAPNYVKGRVQNVQANVEVGKALVSANKDMQGMSLKERAETTGSLFKEAGKAQGDAVIGTSAKVAGDVKDAATATANVVSGSKSLKEVIDETADKKKLDKVEEKAAERLESPNAAPVLGLPGTVGVTSKEDVKDKVDTAKMAMDAKRLENNLEVSDDKEVQAEV